jgi:hypothetical protein
MQINTHERPESQSGILSVVEPGFAFARLREDFFTLRNRERRLLQLFQGEIDRTVLYRAHTGSHEPLFQNPHATDGTLVEKLPHRRQVRLWSLERQLFLESVKDVLKYLPIFRRVRAVPLEM